MLFRMFLVFLVFLLPRYLSLVSGAATRTTAAAATRRLATVLLMFLLVFVVMLTSVCRIHLPVSSSHIKLSTSFSCYQ